MGDSDTTIVDILDDDSVDVSEQEETSYEDLYTFLLANEDIIITISKEDEEAVRRGLSLAKYAHTQKLQAAKAPVDIRQIGYKVLENLDNEDPPQLKLQIWLKAKKSVKIHKIVVSDKEL